MLLITVALFVSAATVVKGDDECVPKPGEVFIDSYKCCNTDNIIPDSFWDAEKTCSKLKKTSDPSIMNVYACKVECMFSANKLLTADKKVDKEAVTKLMTASTPDDMKPVVIAAINKCLEKDADPSLECKSGAIEFRQCLGREILLNCPSTLWTTNAECDAVKAKVAKCPMSHIILGKVRPKTA